MPFKPLMMTKPLFLVLLSLFFCLCSASGKDHLPNIVLVITDDQGYGDLACHGNPIIKTPNLDRLHAESVRLTDYHVSPTCSPTRASLMTGRWANRTGVWHTIMGRSMLRKNEVTLAQALKDHGYATGLFGKWHIGDNYPYRPEDRGFTEVYRHGGGGLGHTPDLWDNAYFDGKYFHNHKIVPAKGFCTDVFFDVAKDFIKAQKEAGKPFFAYISTNAPHGPMHSPPEYAKLYGDLDTITQHFYGMITNIDDNVGKLRKFLEEEKLADNTIFIFTTDNGTAAGIKIFNAGMKGRKGSEYDGGHRVPFFVYYPNGKLVGGRDLSTLTAHVDVMPTLLDYCQAPSPKEVSFDGVSIKSLLEGTAKDWPDRILVSDSQRVKDPIKWRKSAVMTNQWRLINGKELYDIKADPGQENNLATNHPKVVERLSDFYENWWADLEPTFSQDTPIYLGHLAENPASLNSHDWVTEDTSPWNQRLIRSGVLGDKYTGFWNVMVVSDGDYEIELRRWPKDLDKAINASVPPGEHVPGVKAFRTTPGKSIAVVKASLEIAGQRYEQPINKEAHGSVFKLKLKAGKTQMSTRFHTESGDAYGAYYAYVKKL